MIVTITGAIKNVGDYLIGARARKLLREFVDDDIVNINRFQGLTQHTETMNAARAVILCGGPAYTQSIFPKVYNFGEEFNKINSPIIPFGLGWSGKPFGHPEKFQFNEESRIKLDKIHSEINTSSCRDEITESVLHQQGYSNVTMTGCPVWYDLGSIGKEMSENAIKRIVFTTPAKPGLIRQNHQLMKILQRVFPDAELICSFHRGIKRDRYTGLKKGTFYQLMAADAKRMGFKIVDVAYDLAKTDFYRECDLHVGYRVHAHLDFLSRRHPTMLINEDGRGQGMAQSLNLPVLNYNQTDLLSRYEQQLTAIRDGKIDDLQNAVQTIDKRFEIMKSFLTDLSERI